MRYLLLFCLLTICVSCFTGLYWGKYRENWLQGLGLVGLGVVSGVRFSQIFSDPDFEPNGVQIAVLSSVTLFLLGTALKIWKHRND